MKSRSSAWRPPAGRRTRPSPFWSVTPAFPEAGSTWVRWGRTMEEEPFKASSDHRNLGQASGHDGLPDGGIQATLSQPGLSTQLSEVRGSSDQNHGTGHETRGDSQQGLLEDGDKSISQRDKDSSKPEDLDQHTLLDLEPPRSSTQGIWLAELDSESGNEHFSESLSSTLEQAGFRLYLAEQQKKLPLPLRELMETEALEILTKALKSYRSKIGENHFLTQELQRSVEELQRRKRLLWKSQ
ncbi:PREDICTED: testis-expressed sequence 40 protein [Chinchilla lanigera]|uniref:testis-expressed sequence 40 protein n=1 Tax=Chinchilla lanigera TaxID=34839 RepID=UPI000696595F|nr:PREDICTED: testis-expressed sequence 40 protein [Chinchilla lanigera]